MPTSFFEDAFSSGCSSYRGTCECGKAFYDFENAGYDWNEGEFEKLQADPESTGLPYAVSKMLLDGGEYVMGCEDCAAKRLDRYEAFIWEHREQIAAYLKARCNAGVKKESAVLNDLKTALGDLK